MAPDLSDDDDGEQKYSVQSFLVTPEELTLLKPTHTWTTSPHSKGELSIDAKMLRQLSEAGMTIGRQIETSAVDIVLQSTKDAQTVQKFAEKYAITDSEQIKVLEKLFDQVKTTINAIEQKIENGIVSSTAPVVNGTRLNGHYPKQNGCNGHVSDDKNEQKMHLIDVLSTVVMECVMSARNTCVAGPMTTKKKQHHNSSLYELISQALEKNCWLYFDEADSSNSCSTIDMSVIEGLLASPAALQQLERTVNQLAEQTIKINKVDLIKSTIGKNIYNDTEILNNICIVLQDEDEDDMIQAIRELYECDPKLLYQIITNVKMDAHKLIDDVATVEILKKCIKTAVKQSADNEIKQIISMTGNRNGEKFDLYLMETIALAKALGLTEVAHNLMNVVRSQSDVAHKLEQDENIMDLLERIVVMRRLSRHNVDRQKALQSLRSDPYGARKNPKIRELLRRSGIITIVPSDQAKLTDSNAVPISLFCSDNQLAMEDFLMRRQTKARGAFLIVKEGLQAVVPRESSHDVLTGKCAYTVLDENGIRHFEPLHVFSALKINFPSTTHRFSMYSCDVMNGDDDIELESDLITTTATNKLFTEPLKSWTLCRDKSFDRIDYTNALNRRRLREVWANGRQVNVRRSFYL